jgi:hypothetical protein
VDFVLLRATVVVQQDCGCSLSDASRVPSPCARYNQPPAWGGSAPGIRGGSPL